MNIIIDFTYSTSEIYTNFRTLLFTKCDVGYYVIDHGVYRKKFVLQ